MDFIFAVSCHLTVYAYQAITNLIHVKQQANVSPSASAWIAMSTGHGPDHPSWCRALGRLWLYTVDCSWLKYEALHASAELKHSLFSVFYGHSFSGAENEIRSASTVNSKNETKSSPYLCKIFTKCFKYFLWHSAGNL